MRDFSSQPNPTPKQLLKAKSMLKRLEAQYARTRDQQRQEDTRHKIQLGGLIKKAKLDNESTAVLLGLLLEAEELLSSVGAEEARQRWRLKGDIALTMK